MSSMSTVREKLIDATFNEVFTAGYSAASLANILKRADVKKGAMYHYFPSKKDMVLAMIDEKLEQRTKNKWQAIIDEDGNLIDILISILQDTKSFNLKEGCPLGNLLQEHLGEDEDFSNILTSILNKWKDIFVSILEKAKQKNQINQNTNTLQCATFLIASIEGAILLSKKSQDNQDFEDCMVQLVNYINTLRT